MAPPLTRSSECLLVYWVTFEKPPKIANNAKNIVIGRILITVHAIDFALVHAVFPSALVAASGQSIACSTSEYMRMPMTNPTATPINPIM